MRWSVVLLLGLVGFLTPETSFRSSPPVREDLEVPWNDPRTDRTRYPLWFSYRTNKPDIQSKSGFFFVRDNKVFWVFFNTDCVPDHKHITMVGYLNENYEYRTKGEPERICSSSIQEEKGRLIYKVLCDNQKWLDWTLYPYRS